MEQAKEWWDKTIALFENPEELCQVGEQLVEDLLVARSHEKNLEGKRKFQNKIEEAQEQWRKMIEIKRSHEQYVETSRKNLLKFVRPEDHMELVKYTHKT